MEITYDSICKKLGFTIEEYKHIYSGHEDDSKESPFAVLTLEESLFLNDYLMEHKDLTKKCPE